VEHTVPVIVLANMNTEQIFIERVLYERVSVEVVAGLVECTTGDMGKSALIELLDKVDISVVIVSSQPKMKTAHNAPTDVLAIEFRQICKRVV
jgi:hypothetical protein